MGFFARREKSGLRSGALLSPISPSSDLSDGERVFDHVKVPDLKAPMHMVLVNFQGTVTQVQGSRIEIANRFGISQRDLRILDPWSPMPLPMSLMVRKHAILANLGIVRVLISRSECAVLSVGRFDDSFILTEEPEAGDRLVRALQQAVKLKSSANLSRDLQPQDKGLHLNLPFELRALEVSLDEACKLLAIEMSSNLVFDQLKSIRSTTTALMARVRKFKSELEDILMDDQDMLDMYLQRRYEVDEVQNTTMQRLPGDGKGPFSGHHPVVPAGPPTQGVSTFNAPTDVSSADAAEQAARKKSSAEALPVDGSVLGIEAVRKVANGASHAASKSAQLPPDAASIDAVGKKLQQHAEPANASVHLHSVRESYREGPAQLHTPFVADQLQAQPVPTGAAVAPLTVKTMPDLELTNTPLLPEGLSDGEGDEALSAPARIPLRGTVRRFNLVGQHGWALLHSSPSGAGGNANERGKGSIDIADAVLMTVSSVNNHYRRASSVLTSVPEGDRFCRRSSQEQHPIAVQCQPARSFSSNAEAVPLGTVPMLAPEPLMALQGTSGGDGHPPIGAQTSFCPSRHSIQQQTAEDLIPVKVSTTDVIPEERDEHVRDEQHHSVGHSHGGGRAALSSANSTVILQHLLDLKQNANFGPKQVDPHDVQDVENMLEAYSLQADYLLAQLQALSKELDDFQEDTQVDLDRRRNALFALQLQITIVTMGFSLVSMVSGLFGMNLWENMGQPTHKWFTFVCGLSVGFAAILVAALIVYLRAHQMLFVGG